MQNMMIKVIDPANGREVELKAKIEQAVEARLGLGARLAALGSGPEREGLLDRAAYLEDQIDGWVAELYGV